MALPGLYYPKQIPDVKDNQADLDFEEKLTHLSDEEVVEELRYWTVYERRIKQIHFELNDRENKDKTDG